MISRFHVHINHGNQDILLIGRYDVDYPQKCFIERVVLEGISLNPDKGGFLLEKYPSCLTTELERKLGLRPRTFPRILPFHEIAQ